MKLEASGGINLDSVKAIAETGVDSVSSGALTHSAPILDVGLDIEIARVTGERGKLVMRLRSRWNKDVDGGVKPGHDG